MLAMLGPLEPRGQVFVLEPTDATEIGPYRRQPEGRNSKRDSVVSARYRNVRKAGDPAAAAPFGPRNLNDSGALLGLGPWTVGHPSNVAEPVVASLFQLWIDSRS